MSRLVRKVSPFKWNTVTIPAFTERTAGSFNVAQFLDNPQSRTITYGTAATLPSGLSLSPTTGVLSYSGTGVVGTHSIVFTATWRDRVARSATTSAVVAPYVPPTGNQPPLWSVSNPYNLGTSAAGVIGGALLWQWCSDPEGDPIEYARTGTGTAPSSVTVSSDGVLSWPSTLPAGTYTLEVDATNPTSTGPNLPPVWSVSDPHSLTPQLEGTSATVDVARWATDPDDDPLTFDLADGVQYRATPTGAWSARSAATLGITLSSAGSLVTPASLPTGEYQLEITADDGYVDTVGDVVDITVQATGATSWTAGQAFAEGDVPAFLTATIDDFQADILNRWPDGSVKFALISGYCAPGTVTLQNTSVGPSGTEVSAITAADVGTTSITIDGEVVSLTSTIASGVDLTTYAGTLTVRPPTAGRFRDWIAGTVMRESHYYAPVPSKAGMGVFWYVRKYANGQVEIETIVENGWFGITAQSHTYTASVTVNGTVRAWHDSAQSRSITHDVYRRWSRVDWKGTDPNVYVLHDTAYLTDTWLVPNYGWPVATNEDAFTVCTAGTTALANRTIASVTDAEVRAAVPFNSGFWRPNQAAGGEEDYGQIGLLPSWEAVYLRTGDIRALRATLFNARQWQFIPTWRRDERTLRLPRTDDSIRIDYSHANAEREHQPATGYLPYLLTGRVQFLEAQQNTALWNFFKTSIAAPWPRQGNTTYVPGRDGLQGILISGEYAPRAVAWPWRSLVCATSITPDNDALRPDLDFCVESNIEYFWSLQRDATPMANDIGIVWSVDNDTFYSDTTYLTGDAASVYFPAGGTPRYAVVYSDTAASDDLVGWIDLSGATITAGGSLVIDLDTVTNAAWHRYTSFKARVLDSTINIHSDTFKLCVVTAAYIPVNTHTTLADVSAYRVGSTTDTAITGTGYHDTDGVPCGFGYLSTEDDATKQPGDPAWGNAYDPDGSIQWYVRLSSWMHGFLSSAIGFSRGLKLVTGQTDADLASLHAHSVKVPVGMMGQTSDGSGYSWRRCGTYRDLIAVAARQGNYALNPPATFCTSWRNVYETTLNYWQATDVNDSAPTSTAAFDTWSIGGTFMPGFEPGASPATIENSNDIESTPSLIHTRTILAPLAIGADYGISGALTAYNKFINTNVYRDNVTGRQNLANGPRFCITPR